MDAEPDRVEAQRDDNGRGQGGHGQQHRKRLHEAADQDHDQYDQNHGLHRRPAKPGDEIGQHLG